MLQIKKSLNTLVIQNDGQMTTLDISTTANKDVAIETLVKAVTALSQNNDELSKSFVSTDATEFEVKSVLPAFEDATKNVSASATKALRSALTTSPLHLQGIQVQSTVKAVADVYREVGETLLATQGVDQIVLAKSLLAKAHHIDRDLSLVEDALEHRLNQLKQANVEREMRKSVYAKGLKTGKDIAGAKYANLSDDTVAIAQTITKAKEVATQKQADLDSVLKSANKLLNK